MDNNGSFVATRTQMVWAVCLPLAVVVGYLLADPVTSGSLAVLVLLAALLCTPLLLRWHHPLLIFTWNASLMPAYLSDSIYAWMLLSVLGFGVGILNRATNAQYRFLVPRSILVPALLLGLVVVVTAVFNGGIGMRIFGSAKYGGRSYFNIIFALLGMFALANRSIPANRATVFVFLFFLSGVTYAAGNIIYMIGPVAYPLFAIFPITHAYGQAMDDMSVVGNEASRIGGFGLGSAALVCALMAVRGFRGTLNLRRPVSLILLLAALVAGLYSGYRASLILSLLMIGMLWLLEGWQHRPTLYVGLAAAVVLMVVTLPFVSHMPLTVQRSLSFLPVQVHPAVRYDAQTSTEWRVQMWRDVLPEVPRRLLVGRGYALDPSQIQLGYESSRRGFGNQWDIASSTGDFHSGLLSTVIPLGGIGLAVFIWLLIAGGRVLHWNYRHGNPDFVMLNRFIYGCFLARIIYFVFVFGNFYQDLFIFTGLIGLSLSLNGGVAQERAEQPEPEAGPGSAHALE